MITISLTQSFMKKINFLIILILVCHISSTVFYQNNDPNFKGAWKSDKGILVFTGNYFSYAFFDAVSKKFNGTYGGSWNIENDNLVFRMEYNTFDNTLVGQHISNKYNIQDDRIIIDNQEFNRIDDGSPGELEGAWLFSGRKRDGEIQSRDTNQPRKTMKILSGTRFQWSAYNVETGEFSGSGGGTYKTDGHQYTENIDFFSRDSTRVGTSLSFDYKIQDGVWHHSGLNSRGEHMYELWSPRK